MHTLIRFVYVVVMGTLATSCGAISKAIGPLTGGKDRTAADEQVTEPGKNPEPSVNPHPSASDFGPGVSNTNSFATLLSLDNPQSLACDNRNVGQTVYVRNVSSFSYCNGTSWDDLNLRGANGAAGAQGPGGQQGPTGEAGPTGSPGTQGPTGSNGYNSLIVGATESPGTNCSYGGIRFSVGLDNGDGAGDQNDGTLHADEIDSSYFTCNAPPHDRMLRFTVATIQTSSTTASKDSICTSEFGTNYVSATNLDVAQYMGRVGLQSPYYGFATTDSSTSVYTIRDNIYEVIRLTNGSAANVIASCIYKFAPVRFSRTQVNSSSSDATKHATCQSDLGARYQTASLHDLVTSGEPMSPLTGATWSVKGSTDSFQISPGSDSHVLLSNAGPGNEGYVVCSLID